MTLIQEKVWKLGKGMDRRFRTGHPWVYSNELAASPKGLEPGSAVELRDSSGKFLARGYGNPHSLIAFRALTRRQEDVTPSSAEGVLIRLKGARRMRELSGLGDWSYRLCFGEADSLPGLIIDRYRLEEAQVYVIQAHTAGADAWVRFLPAVLEKLDQGSKIGWDQTAIVLRNDLGVRVLEGLQEEKPSVLKEGKGLNAESLRSQEIWIRPAAAGKDGFDRPILFSVDLLAGQKTGFFLDQGGNIALAAQRLHLLRPLSGSPLRILDLCCYVGQWSTQFARIFVDQGLEVEVTAVDASASALVFAQKNIEREGARCRTIKGDVLRDLAGIAAQSFDLVVCDPPALIKSRKDLPTGTHAYLQLNTQALRLVRPGGAVVSCSCSGLLDEETFCETLSKAQVRNQISMRWVGRGAPGPDHPMLVEFPEGRYLKALVGWAD